MQAVVLLLIFGVVIFTSYHLLRSAAFAVCAIPKSSLQFCFDLVFGNRCLLYKGRVYHLHDFILGRCWLAFHQLSFNIAYMVFQCLYFGRT